MKNDIKTRSDIEKIVNVFYDKVKQDPEIGYIFNDIAHVNWEKHLPIMYDFWESIVFSTGKYAGNPMDKHVDLHAKSPLTMQHFQKWNQIFSSTVNELYEGENAERIKQRAQSISTVMQIKLFH